MTIAYLMTYGTQQLDAQPHRDEHFADEEEEADGESLPTAAVALPVSSSSLSLATLPSPVAAGSASLSLSRTPSVSSAALSQPVASVAASHSTHPAAVSPLVMSYEQALAFVQSRRPAICPNDGFRAQLRQYEDRLKRRGLSASREPTAGAAGAGERRLGREV